MFSTSSEKYLTLCEFSLIYFLPFKIFVGFISSQVDFGSKGTDFLSLDSSFWRKSNIIFSLLSNRTTVNNMLALKDLEFQVYIFKPLCTVYWNLVHFFVCLVSLIVCWLLCLQSTRTTDDLMFNHGLNLNKQTLRQADRHSDGRTLVTANKLR